MYPIPCIGYNRGRNHRQVADVATVQAKNLTDAKKLFTMQYKDAKIGVVSKA